MLSTEVTDEEDLATQLAEFMAQGKQAARDGNMPRAYAFFRKVTQLDHGSEEAWLWRAGVAEEPVETKACLEELLSLNPNHPRALEGLHWLREQDPQLFEEPEPALDTQPTTESAAQSDPEAGAGSLAPSSFAATTDATPTPDYAERATSPSKPGVTLLRCPRCGKKNFAQDGVCLRCGATLDPRNAQVVPTVGGQPVRTSHTLRTVLLIILAVAIIAVGVLYYLNRTNVVQWTPWK